MTMDIKPRPYDGTSVVHENPKPTTPRPLPNRGSSVQDNQKRTLQKINLDDVESEVIDQAARLIAYIDGDFIVPYEAVKYCCYSSSLDDAIVVYLDYSSGDNGDHYFHLITKEKINAFTKGYKRFLGMSYLVAGGE